MNVFNLSNGRTHRLTKLVSKKERRRQELMSYLVHIERCRDIIRMGPEAFIHLCLQLKEIGNVNDTFRSTVEEQVAKFLHIIGHNMKNQTVLFFFSLSGETIFRHFHNVLNTILMLEEQFLKQPSRSKVQTYIFNNNIFYLYFKVPMYYEYIII